MRTILDLTAILPRLVQVAERAGAEIMTIYSQAEFGTTYKEPGSPLTRADMASHDLIVAGLSAMDWAMPVLSEESNSIPYQVRRRWRRFWLVDPLDGTKEFIQRNGEFTVNIALIEDGRPVAGVVHAPALNMTYFAAHGLGAFKQTSDGRVRPITVSDYDPKRFQVVVSRSHPSEDLQKFLAKLPSHKRVDMGSSLKICLVAEGVAHLYPRLGPTMEWDTASAQCVAEAAGASVTDLAGTALKYNKQDMHNPNFIVSGVPSFEWQTYFSPQPFQQL